MSNYTQFVQYANQTRIVYGSRSSATVYPGAICPESARFGRVHGPSPATGEITFRGQVSVPAAQVIVINIGTAVFHGIATKVETDVSIAHGTSTRVRVVDMRDKLADRIVFAQFNMIDDTGRWWHIMPSDWSQQLRRYVKKLQTISDFSDTQTIQSNINTLSGSAQLISAWNLLLYLARTFGFEVSAEDGARSKLRKHYPENLDWNSGKKVNEAIEEILSRDNLQFTAWGNLTIHVTEKGVPVNPLEQAIVAGSINLCNFGNFVEASIGTELNDKSRRVSVIGGRNRYEAYYPCLPDWSPEFTANLCEDGWELSELLQRLNITALNKLKDMPGKYQDFDIRGGVQIENKHAEKNRGDMTIRDYIENLCFKAYRVDFSTPLWLVDEDLGSQPPIQDFNFLKMTSVSNRNVTGVFNYGAWKGTRNQQAIESSIMDSRYPLSSHMPSDSNRQFVVNGISRKLHVKGIRTQEQFLRGTFTYLNDGVSLQIENYVLNYPNDPNHGREFWRVTVMLSEKKMAGDIIAGVGPNGQPLTIHRFSPDQIYIRTSIDMDVFKYTQGQGQNNPRSRERIINYNNLFKSFIYAQEQALITQNYPNSGFSNGVKANEIASQLAQRALNHEFLTTAGNIKFRTQAGFMASGIIESVETTFDSKSGTNETINFTNVQNDERNVSFFPTITRGRSWNKGEDELVRRRLQDEAKQILKEMNQNNKGNGAIVARDNLESSINRGRLAEVFGERNQAMLQVTTAEDVADGEVVIV